MCIMKYDICNYCCHWFALLLVTTSIVFVSPEIAVNMTSDLKQRYSASLTMDKQMSYHKNNGYITNTLMTPLENSDTTQIIKKEKSASAKRISASAISPQSSVNNQTKILCEDKSKTILSTITTVALSQKTIASRILENQAPVQNLKHEVYQGFSAIPYSFDVQSLHGDRISRQADDEQIDKCRLFVEGEPEKNEFFSPDYPNDYPKNINCTRVITAPKGQIIRLDFRNSFHIEAKEECKFDFLEVSRTIKRVNFRVTYTFVRSRILKIRDGQYGFSNLIGKYCGTDFPPEITSKERYLWLHFHSDESIEYSGFTAVYEFIDRNREAPSTDLNCTIEKDGYEGFINSSDVPYDIKEVVIRNKIPLDCIWRIQVQDKWKIQVKFLDFKLSKPNDCETNFLDIFPEQTVMPLRVKNFCGSAGEGITSETNILHMRFFAEQVAINSTFAILYTAFRDRGPNSACTEDEYDCEDATCISKKLQCNGRDNCKFRWDEEGCATESAGQSEHVVIIIIVFGLILGGMVITFLVNCMRKIMHDHKIIREHIRQSKESKLDEVGRSSKARSRDNLTTPMPRQKHSQSSLQLLEDTNNRYYREVIPVSLEVSKGDMKDKEHSILRHRNDMVVQTSFCSVGDDDFSEATVEAQPNACDMGCQTRESLFAASSIKQQSCVTPPKDKDSRHSRYRFSTFGYEAQPQLAPLVEGNLQKKCEPEEFVEMVERHPPVQKALPHPSYIDSASTPQEICHRHHQHTHQHIYQVQPPSGPQERSEHKKIHPSSAQQTVKLIQCIPERKNKSKIGQPPVLVDMRNSAPDVIIMTSQ